ncbi:MAG: type II secretion system protein [Vulcanimicrobiota bacterium]
MLPQRRSRQGFTLIELMIAIGIIAMLAAILVPNFIRAKSNSQLTACKSNLKNIATAVEVYSTENGARFPLGLNNLTPNFLKTIPTCPAIASNSYEASYVSHSVPDIYTVMCEGNNHLTLQIPANYPQWSSVQGLIER